MTRRTCVTCGRDSNARICRHCTRREFLDTFGANYMTTTYDDENDETSDDQAT